MYTSFFDVRHALATGSIPIFLIFFAYVWTLWTMKMTLARRYRPFEDPENVTADLTTTVIVPVYDEPEHTFRRVLESVVANDPAEIIVVVDGGDPAIVLVAQEYAGRVIAIPKSGKREAIRVGLAASAASDIIVVLDSDTVWTDGMLSELLKPFADTRVGGVTPTQRIIDPDRNHVRRLADWIEDLRYSLVVPAQSVFGQVGCLAGRTIAYRREPFIEALDALVRQKVLGVAMHIGDDRVLTNELLRRHWRTVFQSTALVWTEAPDSWGRFWKQQLRWGRSSQRETLLSLRWLIRKPAAGVVFLTDLVTPFAIFALFALAVANSMVHHTASYIPRLPLGIGLLAGFLGMTVSIGLRQTPHFVRKPSDLRRLPLFVIQLTFFMLPTRMVAFATMFHNDWGTREAPTAQTSTGEGHRGFREGHRRVFLSLLTLTATLVLLSLIAAAARASAATPERKLGISGTAMQYRALSSMRLSVRSDYVDFGSSDLVPALKTDVELKAIPMFTWDPWTVSLTKIAAGGADPYLVRSAKAIRAYHGLVYIRFGQEMNGDWFPWSSQPAEFVAAWRHIWNVFHEVGATNVRWIWGPDMLTNDTLAQWETTTSPYWPGAGYVNVLGPTMVEFAFETNCEVPCRFGRIDWMRTSYEKPVWLAETKVDQAERYVWLRSLRTALRPRPWVTAVIWSQTPSRAQAIGQAGIGNMNWSLTQDPLARTLLGDAVSS